MIPVYNYFVFNNRSSRDFEVWISGSGTFNAPERDVEMISVPGRNGDLSMDNGRFMNIDLTYPAFITKHFKENYSALKDFLCSQRGYKRLEDTYHPDYYRKAMFSAALEPDMKTLNQSGSFDITFHCDPRRFLKSGERTITFSSSGILKNPTSYEALPLIRAYGPGRVIINNVTVNILSANGYTDLNSEIQEAYKGNVNCNNNIEAENGFPRLMPGNNEINMRYIEKIDIIPNYWTV